MKANELMIGDWVKTTSDWPERYQNKITRVRGLCDENGQIDCDLTEPNGAYVWSDDEDSFEPIPLSKEILKKNGFRQVMFDFVLDMMHIRRDENVECFYIVVGGKGTRIDYVHELQHALRLCGIDKEIVL